MNGYLELILGPMFAGKTTYLLDKIKYFDGQSKTYLVIKHQFDDRYHSNKIISHDKVNHDCFPLDKLSKLSEEMIKSIDNIIIDEGQFFPDLYIEVIKLVETYHKNVFIAGLEGDYQRKWFNDYQLSKLIPICDNIIKLSGKCSFCDNNSLFNKRIIDSTKQILVGSNDIYKPVCRNHYLNTPD